MSESWNPIGAALDHLGFAEDPLKGIGLRGQTSGFDPLKGVGLRGMPPVGTDLFMNALNTWGAEMDQQYAPASQQGGYAPGTTNAGWSGAGVSVAGGNWSALDAHNPEIAAVAQQYGVPANLLKSMINRESSGDWERDNYTYVHPDGTRMYPFVGVKEGAAQSVGFDFNQMAGNKQLQIAAMAAILARDYQQYGSWESAASNYLTGDPNAYRNPAATDVEGRTNAAYYVQQAMEGWHYLDSLAPASSQQTGGGWGITVAGGSGQASPSQVVNVAVNYANQNLPYVLGSVPGKGVTPTSWDCSGMTYWLDQNYGSGTLPMGSHEQYAWGLQNGSIFTNYNQLNPGDLIFFDTGASYRGNAASHVVMYIGNGKVVHAANPSAGTIISDLSAYQGMYPTLGAMHMSWSGGGQYTGAGGTGQPSGYPQPPSQPQSMASVLAALLAGQSVPGYG